jgi:thioredoxin-like negative regulator of GroEL
MTIAAQVDEQQFASLLRPATQPLLVEFTHPAMGCCQQFEPVLKAYAEQHSDTLRVVRINCEAEPELARKFGVHSVPYLVVFDERRELLGQARGAMQLAKLSEFVENALGR